MGLKLKKCPGISRRQFFGRGVIGIGAVALGLLAFTRSVEAKKLAYRPKTGICGAAAVGDVKKVKAYLKANPASVNERDRGSTPLYWAVNPSSEKSGHNAVVELLLANGAGVNIRNDYDRTPLHAAATYSNTEAVQTLLAYQADATAKTKDGITPLLLACQFGNKKSEIVKMLLDHKADPNVKDCASITPLQSAAFRGVEAIVELLIARGAEVNAQGYNAATALHWAIDGGRKEIVTLLLNNGADINAKDKAGKTPLQWAEERASKNIWPGRGKLEAIAKLLRQQGAKE